jgi:hypothetical protein
MGLSPECFSGDETGIAARMLQDTLKKMGAPRTEEIKGISENLHAKRTFVNKVALSLKDETRDD